MIRVVISAAAISLLFAAPDTTQFADWSVPVNLGPVVNSPYTDSCPSVSKDGLSLFFFSNRYALNASAPMHLYVSQRGSIDDPWGEPQEIVGFNDGLGAVSASLSPDEHRLFFASSRPGGCGGVDLWVSRRYHRSDDFGLGTTAGSVGNFDERPAAMFADSSSERATWSTIWLGDHFPGARGAFHAGLQRSPVTIRCSIASWLASRAVLIWPWRSPAHRMLALIVLPLRCCRPLPTGPSLPGERRRFRVRLPSRGKGLRKKRRHRHGIPRLPTDPGKG